MKKTLLPILLILTLTACNERKLSTSYTPPQPQEKMASESEAVPEIETNIDMIEKPEVLNHTTPVDTLSALAHETVAPQPQIESNIDTIKKPKVINNTAATAATPEVKAKKAEKVKTNAKRNVETFAGGTITDGLDIGKIRLGKNGSTTRLVFDSFTKVPNERAYESGHYTFTYNPQNRRITAVVNGYRAVSALQAGKAPQWRANNVVSTVYLDKRISNSSYKFIIQLKQNAHINVYDIKGPGRIVVEITPN